MKTLTLVLLLTATSLLGQKSVFCRYCPGSAAMDAQFPRGAPRQPKPEQAKEQHQAKPRHGKSKNHSKGTQPKNGDHRANENQ